MNPKYPNEHAKTTKQNLGKEHRQMSFQKFLWPFLLSGVGCGGGAIGLDGPRTNADNVGGEPSSTTIQGPVGPMSGEEPCNGWDDDQDGVVDEGCVCNVGTEQRCYPSKQKALHGICACR